MNHLTPFQTFSSSRSSRSSSCCVITLTAVAYTVLLERKVLGRMQNRWGPSRTGPFGLLQPLADGIKLFLKEDLTPILVERPLFLAAPIIALGCALISIAVVPFGAYTSSTASTCSRSPTSTSACSSSSASRRSASTASRSPAGRRTTSIRCSAPARHRAGHLLRARARPVARRRRPPRRLAQPARPSSSRNPRTASLSWNVFGGLQIVGFFIYLMSAYAETNRSPFDLPKPNPSSPPATTPSTPR